jgi:membrane fusion protein, multidrug efflux system
MPSEESRSVSLDKASVPEPPAEPKADSVPSPPLATSARSKPGHRRRRWRLLVGVIVAVALIFVGIPLIIHALNTVSTDDAYVNGHVTFVAPRVSDQVARVLVDDNYRVKKGDVLVELDPEPYQVQVAINQAEVNVAEANLVVAQANVKGLLGQLRSQRYALQTTIEQVDNDIALIRARVATLEQNKATLVFAQAEFDRGERLLETKVISKEEYDQKREALDVAKASVLQSLENIHQARANLGLPVEPPNGASLADVPADLDQTYSSVIQAQGNLIQTAAQLGYVPSNYRQSPKQMLDEFYRRDAGGDLDRIFAGLVDSAPGIKQARENLLQAQRNLDLAKLNLRYCTVVSEIDGVVTRRNVNPGNNVQVGQTLMAVRSVREIWVDANFKETQLRNLRIGQHVDLELDMYGGKHTFEGRISGFTMGTGSTLALLPAQNATGNFVKVVQRLPVRIDLINYDPDKLPLFVGLSVTPTVDLRKAPSGSNAGKFLQQDAEPAHSAK